MRLARFSGSYLHLRMTGNGYKVREGMVHNCFHNCELCTFASLLRHVSCSLVESSTKAAVLGFRRASAFEVSGQTLKVWAILLQFRPCTGSDLESSCTEKRSRIRVSGSLSSTEEVVSFPSAGLPDRRTLDGDSCRHWLSSERFLKLVWEVTLCSHNNTAV